MMTGKGGRGGGDGKKIPGQEFIEVRDRAASLPWGRGGDGRQVRRLVIPRKK